MYTYIVFMHTGKGAQLREWLLYHSVTVLHEILPSLLLNYYCYLVAGVHIVLADSITNIQIDCADSCFMKFTHNSLRITVSFFCIHLQLLMITHLLVCSSIVTDDCCRP